MTITNMPYGVTPISHEVYDLHMLAFYVCLVFAAIVLGLVVYAIVAFAKSNPHETKKYSGNSKLEITWTIIPFIVLMALAIPSIKLLKHIHNTDESPLTILITGYQWKWKYTYPSQKIEYFSNLSTSLDQIEGKAEKSQWLLREVDSPLVIPVNTKVRILLTSDDVIHSLWVPELGFKQDAIPGFINENWFYVTKPGIYRGQCGELCGTNHAFMPIVVMALSNAEFLQWVTEKTSPMKKGTQTNTKA